MAAVVLGASAVPGRTPMLPLHSCKLLPRPKSAIVAELPRFVRLLAKQLPQWRLSLIDIGPRS